MVPESMTTLQARHFQIERELALAGEVKATPPPDGRSPA
jgi:hypothetical protein